MANRLASAKPIHQAPVCDADKVSCGYCFVEQAHAGKESRLRREPAAHADADL